MYSTLILLDKPRHLRYTFDAVGELEQAIPGGFYNLFTFSAKGEEGFRILRDLLYVGLKWEDPDLTIEKTGSILFYFLNNDFTLTMCLWKKVFDAFDYDEWTTTKKKDKEPKGTEEEKEDLSIRELFDNVEKVAYGTLSLKPHELYALTPREFGIMIENHGDLENYRTGMICATIMNSVGGKRSGDAFQVSDFIKLKEPKIMSDDEIKTTLQSIFGG